MIACLDVDYRESGAVAACVAFQDWADERPIQEILVSLGEAPPYEPGRFYRREPPCLLAAIEALEARPDAVIIDGYVWLAESEPGLGARLHEALGGRAVVIGVAKTRFLRARAVREVTRGSSRSPLFVTAAGIELAEAARRIREMDGPHRIPKLLRRVDQLCRGLAEPL